MLRQHLAGHWVSVSKAVLRMVRMSSYITCKGNIPYKSLETFSTVAMTA